MNTCDDRQTFIWWQIPDTSRFEMISESDYNRLPPYQKATGIERDQDTHVKKVRDGSYQGFCGKIYARTEEDASEMIRGELDGYLHEPND